MPGGLRGVHGLGIAERDAGGGLRASPAGEHSFTAEADAVAISVDSPQLSKVLDASGAALASCDADAGEYAYLCTRVRVLAGGLDVTSLVAADLTSSDAAVADFRTSTGSGFSDRILCGRSAGSASVSVAGNALLASQAVTVQDSPTVSVQAVTSRLITSVAWATSMTSCRACRPRSPWWRGCGSK